MTLELGSLLWQGFLFGRGAMNDSASLLLLPQDTVDVENIKRNCTYRRLRYGLRASFVSEGASLLSRVDFLRSSLLGQGAVNGCWCLRPLPRIIERTSRGQKEMVRTIVVSILAWKYDSFLRQAEFLGKLSLRPGCHGCFCVFLAVTGTCEITEI